MIVFSSLGTPSTPFGQYEPEQDAFGIPVEIASDAVGAIWVADEGNNSLAKFDIWK